MKRVMIIGQPGSGKSTFAARLGEVTGLPVVHIDKIHYQPGWIERTPEEKTRLCREIHARDRWIFEGGHSKTWKERIERSDTIIWLDYPVALRLWRVIKRTLKYHGRSRPDMPDNCPERFSIEFFSWIWKTRKTNRMKIQRIFDYAPEGKTMLALRSNQEMQAYLRSIP